MCFCIPYLCISLCLQSCLVGFPQRCHIHLQIANITSGGRVAEPSSPEALLSARPLPVTTWQLSRQP